MKEKKREIIFWVIYSEVYLEDNKKGFNMHYCVLLITKNFPYESEIAEIMQPYNYENVAFDEDGNRLTPLPVFTWDWYQIGGRYNGKLKLKIDKDDESYNWGYYDRDGRNERLFYSYLLTKMKSFAEKGGPLWMYSEEDYFNSMGCRDGFLYVDGARIDDLLNFESEIENCYACIDSDGNAIARESWDGTMWVIDEQFNEKLEVIKQNSKGMFVTVLDIHD
jgi:hypothetical protein